MQSCSIDKFFVREVCLIKIGSKGKKRNNKTIKDIQFEKIDKHSLPDGYKNISCINDLGNSSKLEHLD